MERLTITIYDKNFVRRGWVNAPESLEVNVGHNILGNATFVIPTGHPRSADLRADGARVVIDYEGMAIPLMSGPVVSKSATGTTGKATMKFVIEDDLRILWRLKGWQVPGASIAGQGAAEYRTYTGNAETIVKTMLSENVARIPSEAAKVSFALNQNRGAIVPGGVKIRMHAPAERLLPAIEQAGIGVRCYQSGAGLVVDVYESVEYPKELSEEAGTITDWSWTSTGPTATRVVGGGQGEGVERLFRAATNLALEEQYGDVIEAFADARNGETVAEVDQSNLEVLTEGNPKNGFSVQLSETPYFRYGTVVVGMVVKLRAGDFIETDILRNVTFMWTRQDGLVITPAVGEGEPSSDGRMAKAVKSLAKNLNILRVR